MAALLSLLASLLVLLGLRSISLLSSLALLPPLSLLAALLVLLVTLLLAAAPTALIVAELCSLGASSVTGLAAVLEVRLVGHVGFELAGGALLSFATGLLLTAVALVLPRSFAALALLAALVVLLRVSLWRLLAPLTALLAARLPAILLPAHLLAALLTTLLGTAAIALLTAHLLLILSTAHLLATPLTALLSLVAGFTTVLEIRFPNRVGLEAALLAGLLAAAASTLLPVAVRALRGGLSTAHLLAILLPAHLLAALLPTLLITPLTPHLLAVLLTAHLVTTVLLAHLLALTTLILLFLVAALWLVLFALVSGFAAELEVGFSNRVGFEVALSIALLAPAALSLLTAAIRRLPAALLATQLLTVLSTLTARLVTTALSAHLLAVLLPAHLLVVLLATRLLAVRSTAIGSAASGRLASILLAVTTRGTATPVGFAGGAADLRFSAVPLLGSASRPAVRRPFAASAAAVQAVEPAAVVLAVASSRRLPVLIASLGVTRAVGTPISRSVAVVSVVHGCWKLGRSVVTRPGAGRPYRTPPVSIARIRRLRHREFDCPSG
uniref:Uncharacterized protein n=1 Tax=Haloterrigena alkaliphila TaxID=2816475 RepID=A0A8A2VPI7_9EURY